MAAFYLCLIGHRTEEMHNNLRLAVTAYWMQSDMFQCKIWKHLPMFSSLSVDLDIWRVWGYVKIPPTPDLFNHSFLSGWWTTCYYWGRPCYSKGLDSQHKCQDLQTENGKENWCDLLPGKNSKIKAFFKNHCVFFQLFSETNLKFAGLLLPEENMSHSLSQSLGFDDHNLQLWSCCSL